MMDLKKLGETVRQKREDIGIPPATLAKKVGIGRSTLWILERGENPRTGKPTRPGKDIVEKLADALRMEQPERNELLELAGYQASWHSPTPQDKEYQQMLEALDKEMQQLDPKDVERAVAALPDDLELLAEHFRQEQVKALQTLLGFMERYQAILKRLGSIHQQRLPTHRDAEGAEPMQEDMRKQE